VQSTHDTHSASMVVVVACLRKEILKEIPLVVGFHPLKKQRSRKLQASRQLLESTCVITSTPQNNIGAVLKQDQRKTNDAHEVQQE
jgi:hypothetical protein